MSRLKSLIQFAPVGAPTLTTPVPNDEQEEALYHALRDLVSAFHKSREPGHMLYGEFTIVLAGDRVELVYKVSRRYAPTRSKA